MDAGSFIFELNGVRWSIDPGNQPYHELERVGFDLWRNCQECDRQIDNLKRLELRIPAWTLENGGTTIQIRLLGE